MLRLTLLVLLLPTPCLAGLHYSGETFAELPCRWRGLLLDQRALREVAVKGSAGLRPRYRREADRLTKKAAAGKLSADELADLGALYLRLGKIDRAAAVLRPALADHPRHFRILANLGTAWHLQGRFADAAGALAQAVRLAPPELAPAERLHLKLVRGRLREKPGSQGLDDLLGVPFTNPGRLDAAGRRVLTGEAVAALQRLALSLPADGRLLWLLGEVAGAGGSAGTAAAIMDGCVGEFGLRDPLLLAHRRQMRQAVDALAGKTDRTKKAHEEHSLPFKMKSARALVHRPAALPPVDPRGVNELPWELLAETTVDRQAQPTFAPHLRKLDGLRVEIRGHMQPLGDDGDLVAFLLVEHPVGCWYCEIPELMHLVLVELPDGKSCRLRRDRVRVRGRLALNASDPENFLYTIQDAKISADKGE